MPSIFTRRRAGNSDPYRDVSPTPAALKKHSISGPFNFQHVTHTPRDHVPALERATRIGSVTDFPTLTPDDAHFPDLPPESTLVTHPSPGTALTMGAGPHTHVTLDRQRIRTTHAPSRPRHRRLVKPSKSQDQIRVPPPRPPRPPKEAILEAEEIPQVWRLRPLGDHHPRAPTDERWLPAAGAFSFRV